jgi:hypothetical protein
MKLRIRTVTSSVVIIMDFIYFLTPFLYSSLTTLACFKTYVHSCLLFTVASISSRTCNSQRSHVVKVNKKTIYFIVQFYLLGYNAM